jgi:hypothetical protein
MTRFPPPHQLGLLALLITVLLLIPLVSGQDASAPQRSIHTIYLNPGDTRLFGTQDIRDMKAPEEIEIDGSKIKHSKKLVIDPAWEPRL